MVKVPGLRETRSLLTVHRIRPRQSLGQNFVVDPNTVRKVVRIAGVRPGDRVLEIGAGLGALTLALVGAGARVVAVEQDRKVLEALRESLASAGAAGAVRIVEGDALRLDLGAVAGRRAKMVSNLPYSIATPLVVRTLESYAGIRELTFMVQKEVGRRIAAPPGAPEYGAVSAKVSYFAEASVEARVSRRAFHPVPKVDSVIVRVVRRPRPAVAGDRKRIFRVVEAGFAQRRKTLRNGLRAVWPAAAVEAALARVGVDGGARAEELGIEAFAALAAALPRP